MRAVRRDPAPPPVSLAKRGKDGLTELERVRGHMQAPLPLNGKREAFKFGAYRQDDVKRRLEALFHGKCAYCESFYGAQAPVDVEHYRPKGAVESTDHPGYWWIAMQWENLLPSCLDCNRRRRQQTPVAVNDLKVLFEQMSTGKKDAFPIAGTRAAPEAADLSAEQPLLLDPTRDQPTEHLVINLGEGHAAGLMYPKTVLAGVDPAVLAGRDHAASARGAERAQASVRGAVSIQVYGLNRMKLVQERAAVIRRLRFLETLMADIGDIAASISMPHVLAVDPAVPAAVRSLRLLQGRILAEMTAMAAPTEPYSSVSAAYLSDLSNRL
ncbi:MAG: endonuclease [Caulobacteraceae bacterium]|nr:MAG: endonuclease [Caulobacteraceae bacterium]